MQSPITANVVSTNLTHGDVYPVSYGNKAENHDITEILLKVMLNFIILTLH